MQDRGPDRHDRVISLLKELVASFIRDEANPDPLITVTTATISSDFRRATIFVTVYPEDRDQDALIFLKRKGSELRSFIKSKARTLKRIPHIDFEIDYGERNRQRIDEIVREDK